MQKFDVKGMTCQHCVGAVSAAITRVDPGASPEIDLSTGKVVVNNDSAPEDVFLEAIASEGYEAVPATD
ncbi:MAG: heavy-metal-associated domain-containing protein [Acetobacteraceae bacterium]|nr:heavy-metal-associated domain-containing protein [Acetobacteraceae bacterium]